MSDSSLSMARTIISMQSAATQQTLGTEMLRQNAEAEQSLVAMLDQSAEQAKAILPTGQGALVDRSA